MRKKMVGVLLLVGFVFGESGLGWSKLDTRLDGVINFNNATAEQLMLLPGIGEARAQAVIDARALHPFTKKEDVLAVKGIGDKMIAQWENYLTFDGPTTLNEVELSAPVQKTETVKQTSVR